MVTTTTKTILFLIPIIILVAYIAWIIISVRINDKWRSDKIKEGDECFYFDLDQNRMRCKIIGFLGLEKEMVKAINRDGRTVILPTSKLYII